ncbi:divergent polysaccharide deacetylase family protein [Rhizobium sp. SG2393]|uniref:divergent polysaccharide deacetylase family protein n=1 Tax=Rhizobium sp. SG2393 TaxID=3276279 RepID=UPI00367168F8
MSTDLNAPLGGPRKPDKGKGRFGRLIGGGLLGLLLLGVAVGVPLWSHLSTSALKTTPVETAKTDQAIGKPGEEPAADGKTAGRDPRSGPLSGANVNRQTLEDGNVVTTFSPGQRAGDGPAFIDVGNARRQDPRNAGLPDPTLVEETPDGPLPIVGPEGLRPMDFYARPWSGARGVRVSIVVGGLGLSQTGTQRAIAVLPPSITLAFAASGNSLQRWVQQARRDGHEVLLQLPMEPFDYPENDPGPLTLLTTAKGGQLEADLQAALVRMGSYTGVMNYLGGKFLSDGDALETVMRDVAGRGLLFLDDGSSAQSLSGKIAGAIDMPHGFADLTLDGTLEEGAILRKLDELERIARKNGSAIGVASAFDESVSAIAKWADEASGRGVEIVGPSALIAEPQPQ